MIVQFRAKATPKDNPQHAFNNVWFYGDIIHSGGKCYIHPVGNRVNVEGEFGRLILMHEVQPDTICRRASLDTQEVFWENDVVTDGKAIGIIRYGLFNTKYLGFYIDWQGEYHDMRNDVAYWFPRVKILGNVIDHPELLKAGDAI